MSDDASFLAFVLEQLAHLDAEVRAKAMFGGRGLYLDERFFGVIAYGRLYLKTDETTVGEFVERGMGPFTVDGEVILKNYYEVPLEVLEAHLELGRWVERAAALSQPKGAKDTKKAPARRTPPKRRS